MGQLTTREMIAEWVSFDNGVCSFSKNSLAAFIEAVQDNQKKSLSSQFQLDDKVIFSFAGVYLSGEVLNVHFLPGKVKYDLELTAGEEKTRIYNVDSIHVLKQD